MKHWYIVSVISDDNTVKQSIRYGKKWELIDWQEQCGNKTLALTRIDEKTALAVHLGRSIAEIKKKYKNKREAKK